MTYKERCKLAYDIQDACNIVPVIQALKETIQESREAKGGWDGSDNPAAIILLDKINSLMALNDSKVFDAYD